MKVATTSSFSFVTVFAFAVIMSWNIKIVDKNKELQKRVFISQIQIANKLNLPIVIHTREAIYDTLQILKENEETKKMYQVTKNEDPTDVNKAKMLIDLLALSPTEILIREQVVTPEILADLEVNNGRDQ